jgi:hypothetical protein
MMDRFILKLWRKKNPRIASTGTRTKNPIKVLAKLVMIHPPPFSFLVIEKSLRNDTRCLSAKPANDG